MTFRPARIILLAVVAHEVDVNVQEVLEQIASRIGQYRWIGVRIASSQLLFHRRPEGGRVGHVAPVSQRFSPGLGSLRIAGQFQVPGPGVLRHRQVMRNTHVIRIVSVSGLKFGQGGVGVRQHSCRITLSIPLMQ